MTMRKYLYNGREVIAQDGEKKEVRTLATTQRAFALMEIKEFDEATRRFKGIATSATPDRMEDIVEPDGAIYKLPIPFLYQHDSAMPIGWIDRAKKVASRWDVEGFVEKPDADAPATIVERLNTAWWELKKRLVRGLSIGFSPKEWTFIEATGGIRWTKWEWLELSLVTIPANADATITTVKAMARARKDAGTGTSTRIESITTTRPAASGTGKSGDPSPARAGATTSTKETTMKTLHEQVADLRESLGTAQNRMKELDTIVEKDGFTEEIRKEIGELRSTISDTQDRIALKEGQLDMANQAKPVNGGGRAPYGFAKKFNDVEEKFKGETGLKRALANVIAMSEIKQGRFVTPTQVVEQMWGKTNPTLVAIMKTGVPGGGTDSGEWGAELVGIDNRYTGDFIDYLYGLTVFDQLPLRRVPQNVAIKGQDGAFTGYFVGQSKAIPVSTGDFSSTSTTPYKAAGLTVVSNEWLRDATGDGLQLCGEGLRKAVAQAVDARFLSATAASAGVAPAGILNGLSAISTNGGDAQSVATDIKALFAPFIAAKNLSGGLAWVMSPTTAVALSLMTNAFGQVEFPGLSAQGGTFKGYPVFVGDNVGAGDVILLKPSDIWKIGDLGVTLSTSDSAMIEQDTAPTGATDTPAAATASMVSMFQEDSTAIKVVRPISWGKRVATAVQYVGDAAWGSEQS